MPPISQKPKPKKAVNSSLLGRAELIRKVQSLLGKELPQSQARFSERLTQNMDFTSSIKLSELHGHLKILEKKAQPKLFSQMSGQADSLSEKPSTLDAAFDRVKFSILQNIEQSFDLNIEQPRYPLPKINFESESCDLSAYQSFYLAQQKEMSAKIQGLRTYMRETLTAFSVPLSKLALLDQTLEETIGLPLRSGFSAINKVLQLHTQKIEKQWRQHALTAQQKFLSELHAEIHQFLLAELELRLQPVQGLLDAYTQEVQKIND